MEILGDEKKKVIKVGKRRVLECFFYSVLSRDIDILGPPENGTFKGDLNELSFPRKFESNY